MIDTPQSIMDNRNSNATQVPVIVPANPLMLSYAATFSDFWLQQTVNAETLPTDKYTLSEVTTYGACTTNPAYIGNVSDGD